MLPALCLLTCTLALGQGPDRSWPLQWQLARGQELIYAGSYSEESLTPGVQFQKNLRLDTTILVLESTPDKTVLAVLTTVANKNPTRPLEADKTAAATASVRLELVTIDRQGKVLTPSAASLFPPLDGPPTVECGAIVEVPKNRVSVGTWWEMNEEGRPPRSWRVDGVEPVNNVVCLRLNGVQKSDSWDVPRADSAAWQRTDTVWISAELGQVCRFERVLLRREAARTEPTHRSVVRCELGSGLTMLGKLFEQRHDEIRQAQKFYQESEALLREPDQYKSRLEGILKKIKQYCDAEPPTPYRKAVQQTQKRIEAALRGEIVPNPKADAVSLVAHHLTVGQKVPDFVCTDLVTKGTQRLERLLGKPVVVFFYNPATENGQHALEMGLDLASRYPQKATVLPLAVTDDVALVLKQHKEMKLPFTILEGNGLMSFFAVDALPHAVVLDSQGVMRCALTGWGYQIPLEVEEHLKKCLPR
jgi:hypothetical protein